MTTDRDSNIPFTFSSMIISKLCSINIRTCFAQNDKANATPLPRARLGRRGSTFSSVRLSQRVPSNPIRRNTTRARGRSYKKDHQVNISTKTYVLGQNCINRILDFRLQRLQNQYRTIVSVRPR